MDRPRPKQYFAFLPMAGVVILALVGCSLGAPASGLGDAHDAAAGQAVALSELDILEDPKTYEGPSTARLVSGGIVPVDVGVAPQLPVTVTDSQGTEVTVTDVSRILALDLYGSTSRIVFELGLGDRVVGRDTSSAFPEIADLPLVTENGHDLNAEAILELAPSVIVTDTSLGPWDAILQMRESGIPVVVVDPHRDIASAPALIQQVADALGVPDAGQVLAERTAGEIERTVQEIAAITPADPAQKARMVFLYVRGQAGVYYLFGQGSGADSLIQALGGIDVASEIGWEGMRPVTDEGLIAADPDLIIMMSGGLESVGGVDGLLERLPAVALTNAGRGRRIVDMDDREILSFGPITAGVLDALARAIYAPATSQEVQ
ncbi:MAG: ABC transporter substrate-binding protein [Bifidobacteriaceae bacterium]|jgi:iron complex transport system substrate-binding protein|nr:ABC transporter substrate-binding protein [Bifidobacteriaceae bacterium]